MAISFVHNVSVTGNPPISTSLGHAVSVGDLLLALPYSGNVPTSNTGVAISDGTNAGAWNIPSSLVYYQGNPFFQYLQVCWIRVDTAAASPGPTVTATFGTGFGFSGLTLVQYTGFPTGFPTFVTADFTVNHGTSTAPAATNLVNSVTNELIIETGTCNSQNPTSLTGSFTNRQNFNDLTVGDVVESTTGNTLSWGGTLSPSTQWIAILAGFMDALPSPLIGQTTPTSGNTIGLLNSDIYWVTSNAFASGTATTLNVCLGPTGLPSGLLLGLFDQNGNLLSSGSVASPVAGLNTATISNTPIVYGRQYSISVQATTAGTNYNVSGNPTGTGPTHAANTPNTMPSSLPGSPFVDGHGLMTLYASGALSPGATGTPLGGPARTQNHFRSSGMTS